MSGVVEFHTDRSLFVPIDQIHQHPENPNNGDIEAIAESILANGFYGAVIVQRSTGHILAGNHRYAALLSLGVKDIPAIFVDADEEGAKRVLVADNRTSELSERNPHDLIAILKDLEVSTSGLVGTGYDSESFAELRQMTHINQNMPIAPEPPKLLPDSYLVVTASTEGEMDEDDFRELANTLEEMGYVCEVMIP